MNIKKHRIQFNMYLSKKSVTTIKDFTEGTGLTLSFYIDSLVSQAAEYIEYYNIKLPPKEIIKKNKIPQTQKIRCNVILDQRSVLIVREKLKETSITFSSYIDYLIRKAEKRIQDFHSTNKNKDTFITTDGETYYNVWQMQKILGLAESDPNSPFITDEQIKADLYSPKPFNVTETIKLEKMK